ncbi:MAG: hypothetical protein ACKVQS_12065 [Fimbriimonadaceae bacterium]
MKTKQSFYQQHKLTIGVSCLVLAGIIVVSRWLMPPPTARQVATNAIHCYAENNADCLIGLATPSEIKVQSLNSQNLSSILKLTKSELFPGASPTGEVTIEDIEGKGATAFQTFRTSNGGSFIASFTARQTENGYKLHSLLVSVYHGPILSLSKNSTPADPGGLDKILRLRQIAEFGDKKLSPLGVQGTPEYGDLGLKLRTWQEVIQKYDSGLLAKGLKPLPPLE